MPRFTPVDWKTLERVFLAAGFHSHVRKEANRSYVKPGVLRPVVIPTYQEVPVFIIRNNLKQPGSRVMNPSDYWTTCGDKRCA